MYHHILVAVAFDNTRDTGKAIDVAQDLLAEDGVMTLLHVMEEVPGYAMGYLSAGYREETRAAVLARLETLAEGVKEAQAVLVDGHSGRTIVDWAVGHDVDCIVLASHRPGMQDFLLGSTAAQVVRHARCSVHVVR